MDPATQNNFRARIGARIDDLAAQSAASQADRAAVALDQQSVGRLSRMDALQQQAMAKATEAWRQAEIAQLRAALARIDDGSFGYCVDCGEEIGAERLTRAPAVLKCMSCARG